VRTVLRFDGVWKSYPAHGRRERTLRGLLAGDVPLLRRGGIRWALRGVDIELAAGRSLGIVGHNGAGKSTLLRLLSGLGRPTRGRIQVDPDVASVLNLGAAFDLESSGRENAYTAALVGGHGRGAARRIVPAALRFAELEEFADAPVRTYSDGMRLRLAFGVIAESRPRLLALDEVLAVGDLAFRRKCEDRIAELRSSGTSVVLVSHALEEIRATCDEAAWLHRGAVRAAGETGAVLEAYREAMLERTRERTPVGAGRDDQGLELGVDRFGSQELRVADVAVDGGEGPAVVAAGAPVRIGVRLEATGPPVEDPIVCVALRRRSDSALVLDLSTRADGVSLGPAVDAAEVDLVVERLELSAGEYALDVGVFERDWEHAYDFHSAAYPLRVEGRVAGSGVLLPPHRWVRER
jgi:lipopolysaccharide transport system ATP-binding protein